MYDVIEMCGISKQFNSIWALKDVDFRVKRGEVHTLFGENGAGKSVLIKILSGLLKPDTGEIYVNGRLKAFNSPIDAQHAGIRTVFQEQVVFPDLTVAENICISQISGFKSFSGMLRTGSMYRKCEAIFRELHFNINPSCLLKDLSSRDKQMVEIAKALACDSEVIIMDEPSGSLTEYEIENLHQIIHNLKNKGISVIYISHRIDEVLKISDRITVIRDGKIVRTGSISEMNRGLLLNLSAGEDFKERYPKLPIQKGRVLFKASGLTTGKKITDISFEVRKGEIVGIAGLVGSGRTAIARTIFGLDRLLLGEIYMNGTKVNIKSPADAIKAGIGFVSEERLSEGLVADFNIHENITLANIKDVTGKLFLQAEKEKDVARRFIKKLVIKTPLVEQKVKYLSGGNQQKVALSKWLFPGSRLIIFDEPTIGLDTGSKVEMYNIMNEIVLNNAGIILISSDLPELMGMSDRILIIYNGRIIKEMKREEFSAGKILSYASGAKD